MLNELLEEGEFDVVGHDIGWALNIAALHEQLEVGHNLVLVSLPPSRASPLYRFCQYMNPELSHDGGPCTCFEG